MCVIVRVIYHLFRANSFANVVGREVTIREASVNKKINKTIRDGYESRDTLSTFLSAADLFSKCSEKSQSLGGIWNDTNGALRSANGISLVII